MRVRPSIEGNLDAWEFLKGLKTVFVDTEKRERNVQLLDPVNVDANQFHVTDEFTFSNGTPPDIRLDIAFFINGVPVPLLFGYETTSSIPAVRIPVEPWRLGCARPGRQHFKGRLDDVMIFNRCLSDQEIKQLFQEATAP